MQIDGTTAVASPRLRYSSRGAPWRKVRLATYPELPELSGTPPLQAFIALLGLKVCPS